MGSPCKVATFLLITLLVACQTALGSEETEPPHPSESECRPYIEKALKEKEQPPDLEHTDDTPHGDTKSSSEEDEGATEGGGSNEGNDSIIANIETDNVSQEESIEINVNHPNTPDQEIASVEDETSHEDENNKSTEEQNKKQSAEEINDDEKSMEDVTPSVEDDASNEKSDEKIAENEEKSGEVESHEDKEDKKASLEETRSDENKAEEIKDESVEETVDSSKGDDKSDESVEEPNVKQTIKDEFAKEVDNAKTENENRKEEESKVKEDEKIDNAIPEGEQTNKTEEAASSPEEEDLTLDIIIPDNLRDKRHVHGILKLDEDFKDEEALLAKTVESTLKELKRLYDSTIKPLEVLYKYRDLSNRHFGDSEIFSKPLVLFMGPWSGGKSSIINYLLDNEYSQNALRTGAEPSPAYFNILSWGESPAILDGTQLAADWTFSGLQKFGQGLLDRLRGLQLPHPLLEKINLVEIPGILEIRKQVERQFPFNDACQWFIDRADIIFLVYDPSKLDVGPETEAILDQLKGREYQTRIILNKADQVKPEELMRVQGTLIWNISPLMSSSEPPIMYSTSLWSNPYEIGAPIRLLQAQETAFLRDLRHAIDKRVENKIASARRFAVRVRNHAKMVDCYLTTYYNHKTFFGNKKKVADDIIEHPQNYHIYAGLSTLTNISRYDLPDPEVYRDFFRLNPVFEFKKLSDTCTYFRGCPINRLDVTIAYDLPELVGKYKKNAEQLLKQYSEKKPKS